MMRRLYWPLSAAVLLEGFFLNLPLGWMIAAATTVLFVYLACEIVRAHRVLAEIVARMDAEIAARGEHANTEKPPIDRTMSSRRRLRGRRDGRGRCRWWVWT